MTDDQIALNEIEIVEFSMNLEMNKRQAIEVGEDINCTTTTPALLCYLNCATKRTSQSNIHVVVLFAI